MFKAKLKENSIFVIVFLLILFFMFYSFLSRNGLNLIFKYIFDASYRVNFCKLDDIQPCQVHNVLDLINRFMFHNNGTFESVIIEGTGLWQLLLPFPMALMSYKCFSRNNGIGKLEMYRRNDYYGAIVLQTIKNALKVALMIYLAYLIYFWFAYKYYGNIKMDIIARDILLDWLGKNFYNNHLCLYYLLEGTIRFFIVPFIYTWFAQMTSLEAKSAKMAIFFPCIYYYGLTILGFGFIGLFGRIGIYFSPTTILASGDYNNVNSAGLFAIHLIPIIIGIIILIKKKKHVEI